MRQLARPLRRHHRRGPGQRNYAILAVLLATGRRAQEVATLTFAHTKGCEVMQDELPATVTAALLRWLRAYYGPDLDAATPLWVSLARDKSCGQQLGYAALTVVCQKILGTSKVHVTRHTFAHTMELLGAPVSEIQARLGHKSLATTGRALWHPVRNDDTRYPVERFLRGRPRGCSWASWK